MAQRGGRGGGLPRGHAAGRCLGRCQPGPRTTGEAVPPRRLGRGGAAHRRRPAGHQRAPCLDRRLGRCRGRCSGRGCWSRRRPARAGRDRLHERHHRPSQGSRAQPAQPAHARRGAGGDPGVRRLVAQGRLLPVHRAQHGRAHHAARVAGRRLLDRDGPHRRRGCGRVDPRRAGHHMERATRLAAQPGHQRRRRPYRPCLPHRGVDRWCRLPRGHPLDVRGQVRPAGAGHLRAERGADRGGHRPAGRAPRRRLVGSAVAAPPCAHPGWRRLGAGHWRDGRDLRRPRRRSLSAHARLLGATRVVGGGVAPRRSTR